MKLLPCIHFHKNNYLSGEITMKALDKEVTILDVVIL